MGKFSNRAQVVYAATCWVFGGDYVLSGQEKIKMKEWINRSKTPWSLDDEDERWVISLWTGNDMHLDDIVDAVYNEYEFSLQDKYILFECVCGSMHALRQGSRSKDGWNRANDLREALGIDNDDYNRWAKS